MKHYNSCFPHVTAADLREHERAQRENWDKHFSRFNPAKVGRYVEQKQTTLCEQMVALDDLTDEPSDCPSCSARLKWLIANEAEDQLHDDEMIAETNYFRDRSAQWADYSYRMEDLD